MTSMILKSPRPPKAPQPRRRPGTTAADPFAPMSPGDIQHTVDRYAGMYGAPLPDAQIQTRAQGLIDPIVAAITGNINQRATTASNAIGANSQALAKALGGVDYGAPYQQAEQGQASVDAALRQSLAGQGDALAQDLRSRLGQIQDPAVAGAADTVAGRGAAIGNTELARGSASLGNLLAAAAASKSYGQKMPGIAGLSGLQDIAGVQRQAVDDIAAQTGNLEQQLPSIVQNFRSENASLRGNRAQAAAQIFEALTGQNLTRTSIKAGLDRSANQAVATVTAAQTRADAQATRDANKAARPNASLSRANGYLTDSNGDPVLKDGKKQMLPSNATKPKYTGAQTNAYKGHALTIAEVAYKGGKDAKGQPLPQLDYNDALLEMEKEGIPDVIARSALNRFYTRPGERGRPYAGPPITPAQVAAARAAFNPVATLTGG